MQGYVGYAQPSDKSNSFATTADSTNVRTQGLSGNVLYTDVGMKLRLSNQPGPYNVPTAPPVIGRRESDRSKSNLPSPMNASKGANNSFRIFEEQKQLPPQNLFATQTLVSRGLETPRSQATTNGALNLTNSVRKNLTSAGHPSVEKQIRRSQQIPNDYTSSARHNYITPMMPSFDNRQHSVQPFQIANEFQPEPPKPRQDPLTRTYQPTPTQLPPEPPAYSNYSAQPNIAQSGLLSKRKVEKVLSEMKSKFIEMKNYTCNCDFFRLDMERRLIRLFQHPSPPENLQSTSKPSPFRHLQLQNVSSCSMGSQRPNRQRHQTHLLKHKVLQQADQRRRFQTTPSTARCALRLQKVWRQSDRLCARNELHRSQLPVALQRRIRLFPDNANV